MDSSLICNRCRLCLNKSESLINIFEEKGRHGYVAAEVIKDLLQFEVYKEDGFPKGVCYLCLDKLTDFKIFKDQCICSKVIYTHEFSRKRALLEDKSYPNPVNFNPVKLETEEITIEEDDDNLVNLNHIKLVKEEITIEEDSMVKSEQEEITIDEGSNNMVNFQPIQLKQELGIFDKDSQSQDSVVVKEMLSISHTADKMLCSNPPEGQPDLRSGKKCESNVDVPQRKDAKQTSNSFREIHPLLYSLLVDGQINSKSDGKKNQEKLPKSAENTAEGPLSRPSRPPSVEILDPTNAHECPPGTKNGSPEVVEEYVAAGVKTCGTSGNSLQSSRQCKIKLSILQRPDGKYLGELNVDKDYMKGTQNPSSCRFLLGTRADANSYIQQFRKTFGGIASPSMQISPGQRAGIRCNLGTREKRRTSTASLPAVSGKGSPSISACPAPGGTNLGNIGSNGLGLADILSMNIQAIGSADQASKKRLVAAEVPVANSRSEAPTNDGEHPNCSKGAASAGKKIGCTECGKIFNNRSWLCMHRKIHMVKKPFECDYCDKAFTQKVSLNQHLNVHDVEKPFKCSECGVSFNRKCFLIDHQRKHNREKNFECDICSKRFVSKSYLHHHQKQHSSDKNFECEVCGLKFTFNENFKIHLMIHSGERPFGCDVCGKTFRRKTVLINHVHTHTSAKSYSCHECTRSFEQKCNLDNHMKVHHKDLAMHSGDRPFGCNTCRMTFGRKSSLVNHMRKHTGTKPFS